MQNSTGPETRASRSFGGGGRAVLCVPRASALQSQQGPRRLGSPRPAEAGGLARGNQGLEGRETVVPRGRLGRWVVSVPARLALPLRGSLRIRFRDGFLGFSQPLAQDSPFTLKAKSPWSFQIVRCPWNLAGESKGLSTPAITPFSKTVPHVAEFHGLVEYQEEDAVRRGSCPWASRRWAGRAGVSQHHP